MKNIEHEHDTGYKRILSKKRNFLHFLKKYINEDWVSKIDEKDIIPINTTLIDEEYRKKEADIIYKLKFKNREIIFYVLLELQSSADKTMAFRLLRYMVELMKREFENTPKNERESANYRLPAIIPVIFYNGAEKWNVFRSFKEYLQGYEQFGEYIIDFKYLLFDLNRKANETILSTNKLLDIIFMLDKSPNRKNIKNSLDIAIKEFQKMNNSDRSDMINWIKYILLNNIADENAKNELVKKFEQGEVSNMVYGIDQWVEKERLKGEKRGEKKGEKKALAEKMESVKKLIKRGMQTEHIAEDMGIPLEEVEKIKTGLIISTDS